MEKTNHLVGLIEQHLSYLKKIALIYTKDSSAAADLLQDTLTRIWIHQDKFEAGTNFKAWSSIIMRNLFINECRKQKVRGGYSLELDENSLKKRVSNTGEEKMEYEDVLGKVMELKEFYSQPLLLYQAGFSYKEIAEKLAISVGTVKSRIHTARQHFKYQKAG